MRSRLGVAWRFLLLLPVSAGVACGGGGSTGPSLTAAGAWKGGVVSPVNFQLTASLTEQTGTIAGTGTLSGSGPTCTVSLTGTRNGDQVTLTISCPGFAAMTYAATLHSATMTGTVSGTGAPPFAFDLDRQ